MFLRCWTRGQIPKRVQRGSQHVQKCSSFETMLGRFGPFLTSVRRHRSSRAVTPSKKCQTKVHNGSKRVQEGSNSAPRVTGAIWMCSNKSPRGNLPSCLQVRGKSTQNVFLTVSGHAPGGPIFGSSGIRKSTHLSAGTKCLRDPQTTLSQSGLKSKEGRTREVCRPIN